MRRVFVSFALCLVLILCGCQSRGADSQTEMQETADTPGMTEDVVVSDGVEPETENRKETEMENRTINIIIGDVNLTATLENNESADAFMEMMPVTVQMSGYGGFEQVGSLGKSLPSNDSQTKTSAGDIVLYNSNSVVMFYGSNSWSYTRLGHINDKSAKELKQILGTGNIEVTFSAE